MATINIKSMVAFFVFYQSHFIFFGFSMESRWLFSEINTAFQWKGNGISLESRMPFIAARISTLMNSFKFTIMNRNGELLESGVGVKVSSRIYDSDDRFVLDGVYCDNTPFHHETNLHCFVLDIMSCGFAINLEPCFP